MNKKSIVSFFGAFLFSGFLIKLVSADASVPSMGIVALLTSFVDGIVEFFRPYLGSLLFSTPPGDLVGNDLFIAKVLVLIVVMAVIYIVLNKSMSSFFSEKTWLLWVVSFVMGVLGTRYIDQNLIDIIILPATTFAVTIPVIAFFFVFFVFIKDWPSSFARRSAWIFILLVFLAIYATYSPKMAAAGAPAAVTFVYPAAMLLCFLMALFDGTIHQFFAKARVERTKARGMSHQIFRLGNEIEALEQRNPSTYFGGAFVGYPNASTPAESGPAAWRKDMNALHAALAQFQ